MLHTTPEHEELKKIARGCVTRHHWKHHAGFAENEWRQFTGKRKNRVKALLYIYRVLLTGIHLMRTGEVEANLVALNEIYRLPQVPDLIARKLGGAERATLDDADLPFHEGERDRLVVMLREAGEESTLPEVPSSAPALNHLLLRLRLASMPER